MRRQRPESPMSCWRMAEETQLRAKMDLMEPTLQSMRRERKSLKIENLELDRIRDQLMNQMKTLKRKEHPSEPGTSKEGIKKLSTHPTRKLTEMMSALDMMKQGSKLHKDNQKQNLNPSFNATNFRTGVSNNTNPHQHDCNSEDYSSSDDSDGVNVIIDMKIIKRELQNLHQV